MKKQTKAGRPKKVSLAPSTRRISLEKWKSITQDEYEKTSAIVEGLTSIKWPKIIPRLLTAQPDKKEIAARASILRQKHLDILRVDPLGDDSRTAEIFAPVIMGRATPDESDMAGRLFCSMLQHAPAGDLRIFTENIAKMKSQVETPKKEAYAYLAYCMMIEETQKEPTSLKDIVHYMVTRPNIFNEKEIPHAKRQTEWKATFKRAGIDLPWKSTE